MQEEWIRAAREVLDIEIEGLKAVQDNLGPFFAEAVKLMLACQGRIVVCGLGKSGLVGRKLAATLSSLGTPSFFLHPVEGAHGDLGAICSSDLIVAISNSGETEELNSILPALLKLNCKLVALTGNMGSTLARFAHVTINTGVPREACPLNLAPTASTTAVLAIGDALAVCLLQAKGFTENDFFSVHPGGTLGQRLRLAASSIMQSQNVPICSEDQSIDKALSTLNEGKLGAVLLVNASGELTGILTDGDVRRALCNKQLDLARLARPVSEIMIKNPTTGKSEETAAKLIDIMEQRQITVLPIVGEDNKPLGIVHLHDLLGKGSLKFSS